jgi:CheY-like chemotaxis protein
VNTNPQSLDILLVDDDPDEAFFVQEALLICGASHTFRAVRRVADAMRYLAEQGTHTDRAAFPLPNFILTDLNMPGADGFEFLKWLRAHPDYCLIPALVYSSSSEEADIDEAYRLGANSYLRKPRGLDDLAKLLSITCQFWSLACSPSPPKLSPKSPEVMRGNAGLEPAGRL